MVVEIGQCVYQLLGDLPYLRLLYVAVIFQDFEELSLGELRHDTKLMRSFK